MRPLVAARVCSAHLLLATSKVAQHQVRVIASCAAFAKCSALQQCCAFGAGACALLRLRAWEASVVALCVRCVKVQSRERSTIAQVGFVDSHEHVQRRGS